jgi:hypothetical protein
MRNLLTDKETTWCPHSDPSECTARQPPATDDVIMTLDLTAEEAQELYDDLLNTQNPTRTGDNIMCQVRDAIAYMRRKK